MTEIEKKKMGRPIGKTDWPPHVIEQALLAIAYMRHTKAAHQQLELSGLDPCPSESTMRYWKNKYPQRLAELTEQHGSEIERFAISGYMDIVAAAQELELILIEKTTKAARADQIQPKDLAGALRNVSTTKAINIDKILLYQGKPTKIYGKEKDVEESLRSLANKFAVESDAKEEHHELESGDDDE